MITGALLLIALLTAAFLTSLAFMANLSSTPIDPGRSGAHVETDPDGTQPNS